MGELMDGCLVDWTHTASTHACQELITDWQARQFTAAQEREAQEREGGMAGAKHLFGNLDPLHWCVNKAKLQDFEAEVRSALYWGEITNTDPAYPHNILTTQN